jgi:hypothetical protein
MRPTGVSMRGQMLAVDLEGWIADPIQPWDFQSVMIRERPAPSLRGMRPDEYDFAVAISLDVFNRLIDLSYKRGQLTYIPAPKKEDELKIVRAPVLSVTESNGHGRMHIALEFERSGGIKEWWALSNPYQVEADVDLRVEPLNTHAFNLVIDHVDRETAYIPSHYIDHSPGRVRDTVKGRVDSRNRQYAREIKYATSTPIQLPKRILGLPLHLLNGEFDDQGYVVLYMAYGDRGEPETETKASSGGAQ